MSSEDLQEQSAVVVTFNDKGIKHIVEGSFQNFSVFLVLQPEESANWTNGLSVSPALFCFDIPQDFWYTIAKSS